MAVLVLNSSLQPLSVIPERRLIVLLSRQKVTFVDDSVRQVIEESIQARRLELERPVIVQLLANVRVPRQVSSDVRALMTGCHVMEGKLGEYLSEHGLTSLDGIGGAILDGPRRSCARRSLRP